MSLIQTAYFMFAPADADKAELLLHELRAASLAEPGISRFDIMRDIERPAEFVLWEEYADQAALDAHRWTDHYHRLVTQGLALLAKVRRLDLGTLIQ